MISHGTRPGGKWGEIRESAKTTDEATARKRLAQRIRQVENHRRGIETFEGPIQRRVTVGELFDDLLRAYEAKEIKGWNLVRVRLGQRGALRNFFGSTRAVEVTADLVQEYVSDRQRAGCANATINRETELLGRAFRLAVKRKKLAVVPPMPDKLPEHNARQGFFERDELERLLPHLPTPIDDRTRFAAICGWRRGEILELGWSDVDHTAREIRLTDSKNSEGRVLALDEEDWKLIEKRWEARRFFLRIFDRGPDRAIPRPAK